MKVTTIEEGNDIASMKQDELFGSLRNFGQNFDDGDFKKRSVIALQAMNEDTSQLSKQHAHNDNLAKSIALWTKQAQV